MVRRLFNQRGFTMQEMAIGLALALVIGLGAATLMSMTAKTRIYQESIHDINALEKEVQGYISNDTLCTTAFDTFSFSSLTANTIATTASSATEGLLELNPTIHANSTDYSNRFTIVSVDLVFSSNQSDVGMGNVRIEIQRRPGDMGSLRHQIQLPISFDLRGNNVLRCRSNRVSDDVECAHLGGTWIDTATSTTGVPFCDFCAKDILTGISTRNPINDPAGICQLPTNPPSSSPPPLWSVCSMGTGPGGPDCTNFIGKDCSAASPTYMDCTFSYFGYGSANAVLGCDACPPARNCTGATINNCSVPALTSGQAGGSCTGGTSGSCSYTCNDSSLTINTNNCLQPGVCNAETMPSGCGLPGPTASGVSAGSCIAGFIGSCQYTCNSGTWNMNSDTCTPTAFCNAMIISGCQLPVTGVGVSNVGGCATGIGSCSYNCTSSGGPVGNWVPNNNTCGKVCDARSVSTEFASKTTLIANGLYPGKPYLVSTYSVSPNNGNGGATLYGHRITDCFGASLASVSNAWVNWLDGNAPHSSTLAITAPASGCIQISADPGEQFDFATLVELSSAGTNQAGSSITTANGNFVAAANGHSYNRGMGNGISLQRCEIQGSTTTSQPPVSINWPDGNMPLMFMGSAASTGSITGYLDGTSGLGTVLGMSAFPVTGASVSSNTVTGLTAGQKYFVFVGGITGNKGQSRATLGMISVQSSTGGMLAKSRTWTVNWPDGNVYQSAGFIVTAPADGTLVGHVDSDSAGSQVLSMTTVLLNWACP